MPRYELGREPPRPRFRRCEEEDTEEVEQEVEMDEEEDDLLRLLLLGHLPWEVDRDLLPLPLWVLLLRCRFRTPLLDADRDLDLVLLSWDPTDLDLVRLLCFACLDLVWVVVVVGLESFRLYLGRRCCLVVVVVSVVVM